MGEGVLLHPCVLSPSPRRSFPPTVAESAASSRKSPQPTPDQTEQGDLAPLSCSVSSLMYCSEACA